jgi:subtilase family serine protease
VVVGVLLLAPAIANAGASPQREIRLGAPPVLPRGATPLAAVAAAAPMRVTVVLAPRHASALQRYASEISTPGSWQFRHYLSRAGFASLFAPAPSVVARVRRSLQAHGLVVGRGSANGLSLPVRGPAGAVERAFSLSLAVVRLRDHTAAVINTSAPAVDATVAASIQAIVGLSSLGPRARLARSVALGAPMQRARLAPDARSRRSPLTRAARDTRAPAPCAAAAAAAGASGVHTADRIASAYGFDPLYGQGDEGQGVTIAVYELESYEPSDISVYQSCYGTSASIHTIAVDGGPQPDGGPGSGEAAFDIEQLIALAPRARLLVYAGPNSSTDTPGSGPYDTFSEIVSQDRAQVVSTSWGQCEPMEGARQAAAENVLFEEAAVQGETVLAAAGDDGAQDCLQPGVSFDSRLAVDDPASQPFVTGVGGTSMLTLGPPPTEAVWNSSLGPPPGSAPGAGGGGISSLWPMPSYQRLAPSALNVVQPGISSGAPCGGGLGLCREVPDVAADADPATGYVFYFNGSGGQPGSPTGWQATGGTSGAAPVWAALFALSDASRSCGGRAIGFANPALYRIAAASGEGSAAATAGGGYFNDVLGGNNDFTHSSGSLYSATAGYDLASGLGSANAGALAGALCSETLTVASPGTRRSFVGAHSSLSLNVADARGTELRFAASGLPAGLSLNAVTGVIGGRPDRIGSSTVTVTVTDGLGAERRLSFRWTVEGRPRVRLVRLSQPGRGTARLSLAVAAGEGESGVHTLELSLPPALRLAARSAPSLIVLSAGRRVSIGVRARGSSVTVTLAQAHRSVVLALSSPWLRVVRASHRAMIGPHHPRARLALAIVDVSGGVTRVRVPLSV